MNAARIIRYTQALEFAERQVAALTEKYPDFFPIYTVDGHWHHTGDRWTDWTGGFLAGMMWQFHARTADPQWFARAQHYSRLLEPRQFDESVHDLGFLFLNTYYPWFQATRDKQLKDVLVQAGQTLVKRYQPKGKYLCSFIGPQSLFIDIMMNVPLVFYAANETLDQDMARRATAHCRTTRDRLVRPDGSTAHEGLFHTETGEFLGESTHQGLNAHSRWARGLAWSLYGYSKVFRFTRGGEFLAVAERNAAYWQQHLPADGVPYWDFDADLMRPPPWGAQKDSSAAAIAASGLWDLAEQTKSAEHGEAYRATALAMLDVLVTPEYLAAETPGWEGILKHGVYHTPKNLGVDESVMWGDFFLVEALTKVVLAAHR